jgi:phage terminase Nu1 subunit (DNA packaging protein)
MPVRSTSAREDWITDAELRHRLRYSKSTIQRLRARGLPCLGQGRLRRFHWPTVCDWLAERRA